MMTNLHFVSTFDKVFQYGNLICGLRNLNNSIASGLFIQNNGNSQEIVTCNKCKWNFFLSVFDRDHVINRSIGPLFDHWEGKEDNDKREEIDSLRWKNWISDSRIGFKSPIILFKKWNEYNIILNINIYSKIINKKISDFIRIWNFFLCVITGIFW